MTRTRSDPLAEFEATPSADLTYAQYVAAAGAIRKLPPDARDRPPCRIAVLRNFTLEPLLPVLVGEVYRAGLHPEVFLGQFDTIVPDVSDPERGLFAFEPDFIIVAQWLEATSPSLATRFLGLTAAETAAEIERLDQHTARILASIRQRSNAAVLLNNYPLPTEPTLGILDAQDPAYEVHTVLGLNARVLAQARATPDVYVVDLMRLAAHIGSRQAFDNRYWYQAHAPLAQETLLALGREYARFVGALRGKTRKCLVLDCDNTLWGGVIGEDGPTGIQVGHTYPGACFRALQQEILNLHDRGVILALASKNNEGDVLGVLRDHPEMVLREEHFATWRINWDDKVSQLRQIAAHLNIGLDSLVFVDDNPFETRAIRQHLPEVHVVELTGSPAHFRSKLKGTGLFDSLTLSAEDRRRNQMYRATSAQLPPPSDPTDLAAYLRDLDIRVEIGRPGPADVGRVAQLTQKTNQFNLTTRRYTEGDILRLLDSPDADVFYLRARDRTADLGLVGVAITRYHAEAGEVDSFLMSCRALGRGLEDGFLASVARQMRARGARSIVGRYIPSARNAQCAPFYQRNGFRASSASQTESTWTLEEGDGLPRIPEWITVTHVPIGAR